ncbi:polyadenylate-binding protein 3 [Caerostris extrusa]|uniref:Polyadenylate-binding protein 3 n=1 Tax=Caerostris extrusa TaxID=172846 RepID=A0AAV4MBI4_CAEEX|nr:polyadenylate-binding protein 3 [Caerostris extrusa]
MTTMICIDNLYPKVDVTDLCNVFGKYGRILSAGIDYDKNLASLCRGYVCFHDEISAEIAAKEMNGKKKLGNPVHVKKGNYKTKKHHCEVSKIDESKLFVSNLDLNWDDCDLIKEFQIFGEIDDLKISCTDGKSNGYGFVKFVEPSSAKEAIKALNGKMIREKEIKVETFVPWELREEVWQSPEFAKNRNVQLNNLHVKNLQKDVTEDELNKLFCSFGKIISTKIATDNTGQSKGFGFVCFRNEKDAAEAKEKMDNFNYKSKNLQVSYHQKKESRQKYLHVIKTDPQIRRFEQGQESI